MHFSSSIVKTKVNQAKSVLRGLGFNGLKSTSEPPQWPGRRPTCKDRIRIAQRSPVQAAATPAIGKSSVALEITLTPSPIA
ncbi:hypothetical protein J6590_078024 [Homalodisca vitripennis]|nr:hypothetical protein J6590_078024 [Homalodisca vitripennis]